MTRFSFVINVFWNEFKCSAVRLFFVFALSCPPSLWLSRSPSLIHAIRHPLSDSGALYLSYTRSTLIHSVPDSLRPLFTVSTKRFCPPLALVKFYFSHIRISNAPFLATCNAQPKWSAFIRIPLKITQHFSPVSTTIRSPLLLSRTKSRSDFTDFALRKWSTLNQMSMNFLNVSLDFYLL